MCTRSPSPPTAGGSRRDQRSRWCACRRFHHIEKPPSRVANSPVSVTGRQRRHDACSWSRVRHSARAWAAPLHRCTWSGQPALHRNAVQRPNGATRSATTKIPGAAPTNTRTFLLRGGRLDCCNRSRNKGVAVCQFRHVLTSPSAPGSWRVARRREGQSSRVRVHRCRRVTRPRDGDAH
jgi:hypothetical protein